MMPMIDELTDLYQELILEHNRRPRNFGQLENATHFAKGYNPLCGDEVKLYLHINNNQISQIKFEGSGCAISKASASIMTELVKGLTVEQIKALFSIAHTLITTGSYPEAIPDQLKPFITVHKFPARVKCAMLPWHTIIAAIENKKEPVSTE